LTLSGALVLDGASARLHSAIAGLLVAQETPVPPIPAEALAHLREGQRLHRARDLAAGLRHLQKALQLAGEHPAILEAMALLAADGGDLASAEKIFRHLHAQASSVANTVNLARTLYRQHRYADSLPLLESAIARSPFNADLLGMQAAALEMCGQFDRSLALQERLLREAPSAAQAVNLASALLRQGRHDTIRTTMPGLLKRWPGTPGLLATAAVSALGCGDYPQGLAYLRQQQLAINNHHADARIAALPAWDGQPFDGLLLVSLEAMIGDEILMSQLLLDVVARGQRAVVEVDARCLPLYRRAFAAIEFVDRRTTALGDRVQPGIVCRRAETLDLLEALQRRWTLPGTPGWLKPPAELCARKGAEYRARWPGKKLVGISWRSKQFYNGMDLKSVPLAAFAQTLSVPGVQFVNLQYGDVRAELATLGDVPAPWCDPEIDAFNDIDGLAAQICALDAVVSTSCATAHLAGALGMPTTVVLPKRFPILWHWGFLEAETTWYGSVRLARNPEDTGWAELDRRLAASLAG